MLQGCPLDEQLLSGSLALDVQELHSSGLVGWLDRIAPVAGTGRAQGSATASYEQVHTQSSNEGSGMAQQQGCDMQRVASSLHRCMLYALNAGQDGSIDLQLVHAAPAACAVGVCMFAAAQ